MSGRSLTRTVTLGKRGRSSSVSSIMKKKRVPRLLGLKKEQIYRFVRKTGWYYDLSTSDGFGINSIYNRGSGLTFRLDKVSIAGQNATSDVPNNTEFSALFEFWKIDKVVVRMFYGHCPPGGTATATNSVMYPMILVSPDYSDASAPADAGALQQKTDCKIWQVSQDKPFVMTFRPKPAQAVYQNGAFSGYSAEASDNTWLSTSYPAIENYGLKMWYNNTSTTSTVNGKIWCDVEYHLSFKGYT